MKMRRLCSCIMALLLAVALPLTVFAETYDLANGSIIVTANESGRYVTQEENNIKDHKEESETVIHQTITESTSNTVTINADNGFTANVTLDGVNIDASGDSGEAAVEITGTGDVVIELDGENTVQGGNSHAGVEKTDENSSGSLIITDDNETSGTLIATGGTNAAGIGGDGTDSEYAGMSSNITISGGTVIATGGTNGAGIGGGRGGDGSNITISGGNVTANGGADAAGIGGGNNGNGSNITISGGTVNANGGDAREFSPDAVKGGGAGIGGGAYGSGDNIAIKNNAQVTAEGKGNAANIGNGYSSEATEKQKDKVDLSGLSSFGKVNGVSGSNGSNRGEGENYKTWTKNPSNSSGLKVSDNGGNDLSSAIRLKEDSMEVSVKEDNVLVSGNKADLLQLTVEGVKQINLETNCVNVSVSNEVLNKITGTGGSFQLSTDDTTVNLTATDQNNKKTLDMTLTANKQSGTQAAPDQNSKKPEISIHSQPNTGNNSEGGTLQVSTNAPEATLSLKQKYLQTLQNSEFSKLALAVGKLITTVDSMLAANTAVNGSGSISISDESVIMNGFKFSAADSSENNKLDDVMNEIKFKLENKAQGGSVMVTEVDAKAPLKSASLKVPGSALQSLMDQGVEETALSINGKTTSIKNSNLRAQLGDSQPGITAEINVKHSANDEIETWVNKVDKDGNVIVSVDSL